MPIIIFIGIKGPMKMMKVEPKRIQVFVKDQELYKDKEQKLIEELMAYCKGDKEMMEFAEDCLKSGLKAKGILDTIKSFW